MLIFGVGARAGFSNVVQNSSFETSNVANISSFKYSFDGLTASSWTFTGRAGVSGFPAAFGNGSVDGSYDGFIQQYASEPTISSISQALTLQAATNYTLSLSIAARTSYPANPIGICLMMSCPAA